MSSYPGSEHLHGYFTLTDLEASEVLTFIYTENVKTARSVSVKEHKNFWVENINVLKIKNKMKISRGF
jgi:hypothetical protein